MPHWQLLHDLVDNLGRRLFVNLWKTTRKRDTENACECQIKQNA